MKKLLVALTLGLFITALQAQELPLYPKVKIKTNRGDIVLELDTARAPITIYNFLEYVKKGHYDGTIFHRVIPGFMVQGGGYAADYSEKPTTNPIPNESGNGLSNQPGTIAMARTNLPHTATSQFFINVADNNRLDPSPSRWDPGGHYDGTIFHRVKPGFMVQGGGYAADYSEKPTTNPIPNESGNGLSNQPGTIAMARTNLPHTATSQFFINVADNNRLDPSPSRWGYTVFGTVIEGMDVVDAIVAIPTGPGGPFPTDVPQTLVIIEKVTVMADKSASLQE